ncbi:type II toxin-antitoxin system RelE/ParE family toxin [Roseibium marinum]|uniref:type II toxin-antitoxin system RelE/ParE family toxin n=1 Tax=Roseibium marinum TaxID=281252 RepID=UPI000CD02969|nr:type II toxin-antitoxin system RelE/ParE family toxin [Roseibium marinum]
MWTLDYSVAAERDFELIFDHLFLTYVDLGEDRESAFEHAAKRLRAIQTSIDDLVATPFIGTLRPDILPGLRFVRRDQAAVWFVAYPEQNRIFVAAVFFGAQNHIRKMLTRLLAESARKPE